MLVVGSESCSSQAVAAIVVTVDLAIAKIERKDIVHYQQFGVVPVIGIAA